jgi:site-specific DNA-methyltransferase (adenine-specific)
MSNYKLFNGDCLKLMGKIPNKSIDLILCDLPYGVTQNQKDVVIPFDKLWKHYERIIKDNGAIVLFGQGTFYVDLINSNRKLFRYDLVWDKQLTSGFLNAKRMPLRKHEQIAVFYKKLPIYNPQFTQGKPLHSKGVSYKDKEHKNQNYGEFHMTDDSRAGSTEKYPTSILSFAKPHPSIAKHRTEKPIDLLRYLIRTYTNEGDLVLDNCMGSGSTIVASLLENRRAIGIEIDEYYFNVAKERIEECKENTYGS